MEKGTLKQNGVHLEPHEYKTVKLLLEYGFDIELVPPSKIKGVHIGDLVMQGVLWEMKSPEGGKRYTIKNNVQNAMHQAQNMIMDLRRCKLDDEQAISETVHYFKMSKRLRRLKIITKSEKVLDFVK